MALLDRSFFLIGGKGFLGSAFAAHLESAGAEVVRWGRGDVLDDDPRIATLRSCGRPVVVIDFAYTSVPNSSFEDPVKDYSDNLRNVLRHAEFVRNLPCSVYVYISSGGTVYGNPARELPIAEDHANVPLAPYGITKLACERYGLMYSQVHGVDVRIVRPSNVYGPGQRPFRGQGIVPTMMALLIRGNPVQVYGDGSTVRDYVYVDDFCRALDDVIGFGRNGEIYNIGSGQGVSINDLLDRMQREIGKPTKTVQHQPSRPFDVRYNVLDAAKLRALDGWAPEVPLDTGLGHAARWLHGHLGSAP